MKFIEFVELVDALDHLIKGKTLYSECYGCAVLVQRAKTGALEVLIYESEDKTKSPWRFGAMNDKELITFMAGRSERWTITERNQPAYIGEY